VYRIRNEKLFLTSYVLLTLAGLNGDPINAHRRKINRMNHLYRMSLEMHVRLHFSDQSQMIKYNT